MVFTTLDIIVRRTLLERGLPIHFYSEFLYYASTCLRELTIDTLKVVNTKNIPVSDYGSIDFPEDFLDDVMVSFDGGAILRPIPHRNNVNPIRLHNTTTGVFEQQSPSVNYYNNQQLYFPFVGYTWYYNVSDYGEPTGRIFGAPGNNSIGYSVIKERRQIQIYGCAAGSNVILQYISDGQSVDNASMVDTLAFMAIQNWIIWKQSPNADNEYSPQGRQYYNTKRKLRSHLSQLTLTDIKDVVRANYHALMKN